MPSCVAGCVAFKGGGAGDAFVLTITLDVSMLHRGWLLYRQQPADRC